MRPSRYLIGMALRERTPTRWHRAWLTSQTDPTREAVKSPTGYAEGGSVERVAHEFMWIHAQEKVRQPAPKTSSALAQTHNRLPEEAHHGCCYRTRPVVSHWARQ